MLGWQGPVTHRQFLAWQAWANPESSKTAPKPPKFPGLSGPPIVTKEMVDKMNNAILLSKLGLIKQKD